jgi:hypothetical protein
LSLKDIESSAAIKLLFTLPDPLEKVTVLAARACWRVVVVYCDLPVFSSNSFSAATRSSWSPGVRHICLARVRGPRPLRLLSISGPLIVHRAAYRDHAGNSNSGRLYSTWVHISSHQEGGRIYARPRPNNGVVSRCPLRLPNGEKDYWPT